MANTTSPAGDQIAGISVFKIPDIAAAYSTAMYPDLPCPTHIFIEVNRITRLRVQLQGKNCPSNEVSAFAAPIFHRIDSFEPDAWEEMYALPPPDIASLLARIYKSSATLYGILSLSLHRRPSFILEQDTVSHAYNHQRVHHRKYLLKMIGDAMRVLPSLTPLCWPLAVLGVALADGDAAEQAIVVEFLYRICAAPETYRGPLLLIPRLQQFWLSGRCGWEDCFNQPCTVLG